MEINLLLEYNCNLIFKLLFISWTLDHNETSKSQQTKKKSESIKKQKKINKIEKDEIAAAVLTVED